MPTIYEVVATSENNGRDIYYQSFTSRVAAEEYLPIRKVSILNNVRDPKYAPVNWRIEEHEPTSSFVLPTPLKPRSRFSISTTPVLHDENTWNTQVIKVHDLYLSVGQSDIIFEYEYNYSGRPPFEPFRQGDRNFALAAKDYTATSVIDLDKGEWIAGEERNQYGFCPVELYVPDYYDNHDVDPDRIVGDHWWDAEDEWPTGDFGFVAGCVWGDDNSWKIQYLDLSRVQEGILSREERFGYIELPFGKKLSEVIYLRSPDYISIATLSHFNFNGRRSEFQLREILDHTDVATFKSKYPIVKSVSFMRDSTEVEFFDNDNKMVIEEFTKGSDMRNDLEELDRKVRERFS